MAERLGPVDEATGVPLPIYPIKRRRTFHNRPKLEHEYGRKDKHHPFFKNADLVTEGERVVRHSRVQYGVRWDHCCYHGFYDGVPLPRTAELQFRIGILATARYIPEFGVDVSGNEPVIRRLPPNLRRRMQHELIMPEARISKLTGRDLNQVNRGIFFMNYALDQGFDCVGRRQLEEFAETTDSERRLKLGFYIVNQALKQATASLDPLFQQAHDLGYLPAESPNRPANFLRTITAPYQPDYFPHLRERILQSVA